MKINLFIVLIFWLFLFSCKKEDDTVIVDDNTAPPDNTIASEIINNYIGKCYIGAIGREPSATEKNDAKNILTQNNFSEADRRTFVEIVIANYNFNANMFNIARAELLNNIDTIDIQGEIDLLDFFLSQPDYEEYYDQILKEKQKLLDFRAIPAEMANNTLSVEGMLRRCVNTKFYDDINMGTENFVVSNFQNFLLRYPSNAELEQGSEMVDGFQGILFLQLGFTKQDFMDIIFNSDNFKEGRVRYLFKKYLFREPTSEEMFQFTEKYRNSNSFKSLLTEVMITKEYAGLK